ncbi:MAG: cation:proton antiporter [Candidatus Delongbacteria bacterium]|nr:cation:proton antiporter [Candidatus Delongbacteria bacterium]
MILLNITNISLPIAHPVLKFFIILIIILSAPIILNKFKIPHILGLIIAGALIGPNAINLLERDSGIILSGTAGLLYIMFLAGLEIDLVEFKKNSLKSIIFGLYTFIIPMTLGTVAGIYLLRFSLPTSMLLASMFASHTLIAYPILTKLEVHKNRAVNITIGGTMITDTLALLVLAVIVGMAHGEVGSAFWIKISFSLVVFASLVLFGFPIVVRWFFKNYTEKVSQYIFILAMVFLGSILAELAGIEAIIGAFLTGLSLNRLIPSTSPLMNRIEFVGNAIFIPFFLIGVGMLVDFKTFFVSFETIKVAIVMIVMATGSKYAAAWLTQKTFKFTNDERRLIFGLSNAQAAATLAAVLVGYNVIIGTTTDGEPIRLLSESVLNGTIIMILVTCTIASLSAQKGAMNISILSSVKEDKHKPELDEKILVTVSNPDTIDELIHLSLIVKSNYSKLFALNVINSSQGDENAVKHANKLLEKAIHTASAADVKLHKLVTYDIDIISGITNAVVQNEITDLIIGLRGRSGISESFLGNLTKGVVYHTSTSTFVYKSAQPISTVKRHLVILPKNAELETGFPFWLLKIWNIARNTGAKLVFFGTEKTIQVLLDIHKKNPIEAEFKVFDNWDDFLIISRDIKANDSLIIVMSRIDFISYQKNMAQVPSYLNKYFQQNNFILIYPAQMSVKVEETSNLNNPSLIEPIEKIDEIRRNIARLFKHK